MTSLKISGFLRYSGYFKSTSFTFKAIPSMIILWLNPELISTLATSCERSTENDGMNSVPFLSITSFAKSINPFSDSFLGI